jgi:hypothetical protein
VCCSWHLSLMFHDGIQAITTHSRHPCMYGAHSPPCSSLHPSPFSSHTITHLILPTPSPCHSLLPAHPLPLCSVPQASCAPCRSSCSACPPRTASCSGCLRTHWEPSTSGPSSASMGTRCVHAVGVSGTQSANVASVMGSCMLWACVFCGVGAVVCEGGCLGRQYAIHVALLAVHLAWCT